MPKTTDLTAEKSNISNIYLKSKSANSLIRKPRFLKRQNSTKEGEKQVIKAKIVGRAQYKLESNELLLIILLII